MREGQSSCTYEKFPDRLDEALSMRRDIYSGRSKLNGEEREETLLAASNYAVSLKNLDRFEEAKSLLRKSIPVARRVLGENNETTIRMRWYCAVALCNDGSATLDDLREAVAILEELEQTTRRVLGGAHPTTKQIVEFDLRDAKAALAVREESAGNSDVCAVRATLDAMKAT